MARSLKKIHIVDIESTCWRSGAGDQPASPSGNCRPNEIIEIGICRMILDTLEIEQVKQYYCRPVWHPVLSDFCVELTGIQQSMVDAAPSYIESMTKMREDFGKNALISNPWVSWGDYDRMMFDHMAQEILHEGSYKDRYPWGRQHINLKTLHGLLTGVKKSMGVSGALVSFGMKFEGRPHCGMDDAYNIARIIQRILQKNRNLCWWSS